MAKKRRPRGVQREAAPGREERWRIYGAVPQADWIEMSGRQAKVLNEQAARYGIPFGALPEERKGVIDLPAVVRALHDFLAANARRLSAASDQDAKSFAEAELRLAIAKAAREELKLKRERNEVIDIVEALDARVRIVRWMIGVFERAGAELAPRLAGRKPAQVKRIAAQYFDDLREEALRRTPDEY